MNTLNKISTIFTKVLRKQTKELLDSNSVTDYIGDKRFTDAELRFFKNETFPFFEDERMEYYGKIYYLLVDSLLEDEESVHITDYNEQDGSLCCWVNVKSKNQDLDFTFFCAVEDGEIELRKIK